MKLALAFLMLAQTIPIKGPTCTVHSDGKPVICGGWIYMWDMYGVWRRHETCFPIGRLVPGEPIAGWICPADPKLPIPKELQ